MSDESLQENLLEFPKYHFKLTDEFKDEWKDKTPGWNALAEVVYRRTYSRIKDDGTNENWFDTCVRVTEGTYTWQLNHCRSQHIPWNYNKAQKSAQKFFVSLFTLKWTPPGRGLWAMGTDAVYVKGGGILNNCGYTTTENIGTEFSDPFCWLMDMSMLGVGIGFDTKGSGIVTIKQPRYSDDVFTVADTREGWVDVLRVILDAYAGRGSMPYSFDYSQVRPAGTPLKTFGGIASGPGPLRDMELSLRKLLDKYIDTKLDSAGIVDIMNFAGKCVVSGGIRRSAEIAFGEPDDEEFMSLKDPELHQEELYDRRWNSNNSIFAVVGMDYTNTAAHIAKNGEPGTEWLENAQAYSRMIDLPDYKDYRARGGNPCLEQTLEPYELCCLVETYPSRHETLNEWQETLKYAYLYAKTVTLIPTHDVRTNSVMFRNRRIGTSASGVTQSFEKHGRRATFRAFDAGYKQIQNWDRVYSEWFGIPESIKTTSVKPSGTVSILAEVTPGIHYAQSRCYIRNVRVASQSPLLPILKKAGYWIEPDKYSINTMVVSLPVKLDNVKRTIDEVSMWEQLENAAQMQAYWSDNQVSVTIQFDDSERDQIASALELYETRLKGVSFLPKSNHGYDQAPYIPITEEEYVEMMANVKPLDFDNVISDREVVDAFCDTDACEIKEIDN